MLIKKSINQKNHFFSCNFSYLHTINIASKFINQENAVIREQLHSFLVFIRYKCDMIHVHGSNIINIINTKPNRSYEEKNNINNTNYFLTLIIVKFSFK
jgi:hypothetical protein